MGQFFLGEIRLFPWDFAPRSWALCAGQLLPIAQNQALFSLLGTTYGGNGVTTFALPDLRGRVAVGQGGGGSQGTYTLGEVSGQQSVTLLQTQMPSHTHSWAATSDAGNVPSPSGNRFGGARLDGKPVALYAPPNTGQQIPLAQTTLGIVGGSQPHNNIQPYTGLNYCIALQGIFPSRN